MIESRLVFATLSAALFGCGQQQPIPGHVYDSQILTEEEISTAHVTTAYDAVQKLRANFLSYRGVRSDR
jgi:hypothetical protein